MNVSRAISSMGPFVILDLDKLFFLKEIGKKAIYASNCMVVVGSGGPHAIGSPRAFSNADAFPAHKECLLPSPLTNYVSICLTFSRRWSWQ